MSKRLKGFVLFLFLFFFLISKQTINVRGADTYVKFSDNNILHYDDDTFFVSSCQESGFLKVYLTGELDSKSAKNAVPKNTLLGQIKIGGVVLTSKEKLKVMEVGADFGKYARYQKLAFDVTVSLVNDIKNANYSSLFRSAEIRTNAQAYGQEFARNGSTIYMNTVYLMRNKTATPVSDIPGAVTQEDNISFSADFSSNIGTGETTSNVSGKTFNTSASTSTSYKANSVSLTADSGGDTGDARWMHIVTDTGYPRGELLDYMRSQKNITGIMSWHLPAETYSEEANPGVKKGFDPYTTLKKGPYNYYLKGFTVSAKVYFGISYDKDHVYCSRKNSLGNGRDKKDVAIGEVCVFLP